MTDEAKSQAQDQIAHKIRSKQNELSKAKQEMMMFCRIPNMYIERRSRVKALEREIAQLQQNYDKLN